MIRGMQEAGGRQSQEGSRDTVTWSSSEGILVRSQCRVQETTREESKKTNTERFKSRSGLCFLRVQSEGLLYINSEKEKIEDSFLEKILNKMWKSDWLGSGIVIKRGFVMKFKTKSQFFFFFFGLHIKTISS